MLTSAIADKTIITQISHELKFKEVRTYAIAPLAPQYWGNNHLTPPKLGGHRGPLEGLGGTGGQINGLCVSPGGE